VGKSSSAKRRQFWRADWFVAVRIVIAVVVLHQATDAIGTVERPFASTSSGRQPSYRIAVIAIDDQSIANIGRWPWPRDVHAQLIDQLAAAKAKTIVYTTFFFEADPVAANRAAPGAGRSFEPTVVGMRAPPGYDSAQETDAGDREAFAKTAVIGRPGTAGAAAAGAEKTDPEA
jgi:hypothetical protein